MITLNINGKVTRVDVAPDTPLLWVLRDTLQMTGTKFGCGMALCETCTVHYVGAVGSRLNNDRRRERLASHFDFSADELARLHGPVGLPIGSHTPPEIAVAILAEMVAVRNGVSLPSWQQLALSSATTVACPVS